MDRHEESVRMRLFHFFKNTTAGIANSLFRCAAAGMEDVLSK
jgi:hypothetical protein